MNDGNRAQLRGRRAAASLGVPQNNSQKFVASPLRGAHGARAIRPFRTASREPAAAKFDFAVVSFLAPHAGIAGALAQTAAAP